MKYNDEKITCSVAVATYKRPELLSKLISSLLDQKVSDKFILEIIIVDNDEECSAKNIVENFIQNSDIIIKYFVQPIKNISLTRNLGIQNAIGDFIAFIDDDETAEKNWVMNLVNSCIKYDADAVFGYVEPKFEELAPAWLKQRELYFKPLGQTGTEPEFWYTTNCLIKSEILKKNNILFEVGRGLSGGEDGLFFRTLKEKCNAKFISCKEAITFEYVPIKRLNTKYLCSRNFQIGNLYAKRKKNEINNFIVIKWFFLLLRFIIAYIFYLINTLLLYLFKKKWIFNYTKLCAAAGKLSGLFNYKYEHYKKFE